MSDGTQSGHYYEREDAKYQSVYKAETPDILSAFFKFDDAVFATEGREIPIKYRQLMALSVALTTQCAYCIDFHVEASAREGATQTELAEAAWVATAVRAGGGFAHGRLAFKLATADSHAHA